MRNITIKVAAASAALLATALVPAGTSQGAAPASGKTPHDGRIAYVEGNLGRISTVNPDGSAVRAVTPEDAVAQDQDWSPDGTHLAYSSDQAGDDFRIFIMRRDGTGRHQVTGDSPGFFDFGPTYTPAGAGLVYTRCRPDPRGGCALAFVHTDGTGKKMLTAFGSDPADFFPDVSPDGKHVAFTRFNSRGILAQVWVMRISGTHGHAVTPPAFEGATPKWTPDGHHLLVTSLFDQLAENVYRIRADGSHLQKLTNVRCPHNDSFPAPSPSGARIAYSDDRAYPDVDGADLFVMWADGSQKHAIVSGTGLLQDPDWGTAPLLNGASSSSTRSAPSTTRTFKALPNRVADLLGHSVQAHHKRW